MTLTKQQQNIIAVAALVVIGAGAFLNYVHKPLYEQVEQKKKKLDETNARIIELSRKADQLDRLKQEYERLVVEIGETEKQLPTKEEIANLLRYLTDISQKTNVNINSFQPKPQVQKDYYVELPFGLDVTANYHSLAQFINTINQAERIIGTRDITFRFGGDAKKGETISCSFDIVTYMLR